MKKVLLSLLVLTNISTVSVFSQIKMAQMPEKEKKEVIFTYDSLTNVDRMKGVEHKNRFKHLTGQKIVSISSSDYSNFFKYGGEYSSIKSYRNGEYIANLENKTFVVDSVSGSTFYLKEENNPYNSIILYVDSDYEWMADFAWVSLGYFEKIKQLYLGKELVYIHKDEDFDLEYHYGSHSHDRFMDYNTKRNLTKKIPRNSVWKCTDVLVLPGKLEFGDCDNRVILNIENDKYGKYYIFASKLLQLKEWKRDNFLTMEEFHKYQAVQNQLRAEAKAKAAKAAEEAAKRENERRTNILARYGEYYGNLILQGKIVIGMTKQQCIDAIGNPTRINRTTTASTIYEQWVYSGRYLYFENGKLVTIQD